MQPPGRYSGFLSPSCPLNELERQISPSISAVRTREAMVEKSIEKLIRRVNEAVLIRRVNEVAAVT